MKDKVIKSSSKIWWLVALFINIILTVQAIFTQNILGCVSVTLFSLFIAKYGDPIIFEKYNQQRKIKYEIACRKRNQFNKRKTEEKN